MSPWRPTEPLLAFEPVNLPDLYRAYGRNEAAADARYRNKGVEFILKPLKIDRDPFGRCYVSANIYGLYFDVDDPEIRNSHTNCYFRLDQAPALAEFKSGQSLTIRGACAGKAGELRAYSRRGRNIISIPLIEFRDCFLVGKPGDSTDIPPKGKVALKPPARPTEDKPTGSEKPTEGPAEIPAVAGATLGEGGARKKPLEPKSEAPARSEVLFFASVTKTYQIGDRGTFPRANPLTQTWNLKNLSEEKRGFSHLCVKVRKDNEILAQVRHIEGVSSYKGRGNGLGIFFSRSFVVKGIDASTLKDHSVWEPGKTVFKVVATEEAKPGELCLVFEPVDKPLAARESPPKEATEKPRAAPKPRAKEVPAGESHEDPESEAARKLKLAKALLKNADDAGVTGQAEVRDKARSRFREIIDKYPDTKTASEAKKELKKLDG
jgi:hypothetical protein